MDPVSLVGLIKQTIKSKTRNKYGNYYYPEDLASNKQDRINLQ